MEAAGMKRAELQRRAEAAIAAINASLPPFAQVKALPLIPEACWHAHPLNDPALAEGLFPLHPHLILLLPVHHQGAVRLGLPVHPGALPASAAVYMQRQVQRLGQALPACAEGDVTVQDIDSAHGVLALMQRKAEAAVDLAEGLMKAAEDLALVMLGRKRLERHERVLATPYKRAMGYAAGLSERLRFLNAG